MKLHKEAISVIDRVSPLVIIAALLVSLLAFAFAYYMLSEVSPGNGLSTGNEDVTFLDALYFSVVTESTLGYGDIAPIGWSRFLASMQVVVGLFFVGIAVSKITAAPAARRRRLLASTVGTWWNSFKNSDGRTIIGILEFTEDEGELKYGGTNYDSINDFQNTFSSTLIWENWPSILFRYTNEVNKYLDFSNGVVQMRFQLNGDSVPISFSGTFIDFNSKEEYSIEGYRIEDESLATDLNRIETRSAALDKLRKLLPAS